MCSYSVRVWFVFGSCSVGCSERVLTVVRKFLKAVQKVGNDVRKFGKFVRKCKCCWEVLGCARKPGKSLFVFGSCSVRVRKAAFLSPLDLFRSI